MISNLMHTMGPWALVTGASSGLGAAFARSLAARGLNLVLTARSADVLADFGRELSATYGVEYRVVVADLSERAGTVAVLSAIGDLDVGLLVSNAGAGHPAAFLGSEIDALRTRAFLNASSHLELTHAIAPRLVERGRGGILLMSALGATDGIPHMALDSAAKSFVASLGSALHRELAPHGVTVTVMTPGNVDTPIMDAFALDRESLPMSPFPADRAVEEALRALTRGQERITPDRRMRIMMRLTTRSLRVRMNGRMLGQAALALEHREFS